MVRFQTLIRDFRDYGQRRYIQQFRILRHCHRLTIQRQKGSHRRLHLTTSVNTRIRRCQINHATDKKSAAGADMVQYCDPPVFFRD